MTVILMIRKMHKDVAVIKFGYSLGITDFILDCATEDKNASIAYVSSERQSCKISNNLKELLSL